MTSLRDNWRVVLLVIFLLVSLVALFAPADIVAGNQGGTTPSAPNGSQAADSGPTNLKYGLELDGGTRVRAPVVGTTAEGVNVTVDNQAEVERTVASNLNADVTDVTARPSSNTVEVFTENVSEQAFRSALEQAGVSPSTIREGVTEQTRQTTVNVVQNKISEAGLSGGTVQEVTTANGDNFIVIEIPNENRSSVKDLVDSRGVVRLVAHYPVDGNTSNYRNVTLVEQNEISYIGPAQPPTSQQPMASVPITLKDQPARNYSEAMQKWGYTSGEGVQNCRYSSNPDNAGYCLYTVLDEEVVYAASMGPILANTINSGQFVNDPGFVITANNMSEARELQLNLRAGALPAPLDLEGDGTSYYLSPSLAEQFKLLSFLTGLIAALAVTGTVFVRYGDPKVAAPMLVTALSEVVILLGFAAAIQLPLDLSHIAGFIAVIGTGVDDLIIIADEVMAEGDVSSGRVFQSRFRKAFWVIGAAAATTIIAMSPLAVMSLGDLQGFALITILGVLIGVLVTRPAYGDVLRYLLTDNR